MSTVLITGGTGNLGRHASWVLLHRGHTVRVLTHRSDRVVEGAQSVSGDVVTGTGLSEAFEGVDAVLHAATRPVRHARRTEVEGTRNVLEAAKQVGAHVVYPSIVGVDRHRLRYYDAKWEAEQLVEDSGSNWTIQRTTQFHDLIDMMLGHRFSVTAPGWAFQPVDVAEVAARLCEAIEAGPSGRVPDFGGPELLGIRTLARRREAITGKRTRLIRVPTVGVVKDYVHGLHLAPVHRDGRLTWDEWLRQRA